MIEIFLISILGIFAGALPGISPTLAVALLLPFTFLMDPVTGIFCLNAMYICSIAGGAYSAVILGIPGAPANVATLEPAKILVSRGRGEETLFFAMLASAAGTIFGFLCLIPLSNISGDWLVWVDSKVIFYVLFFSSVVIILVDNDLFKACVGFLIGGWIGLIGVDPMSGQERFVFLNFLSGGIPFAVLVLGVFGIPPALKLILGNKSFVRSSKPLVMPFQLISCANWFWRQPLTLATSAVIGMGLGVLPGAGGQVSGVLARKVSSIMERFTQSGNLPKDDLDRLRLAVISSETANNSMVAGSLLPLFLFSIPGSPTAAVFLGGLIVHGFFPSINFFGNFPVLIDQLIYSGIFAAGVILIVFVFLRRVVSSILSMPQWMLGIVIFVACVLGAYYVNRNPEDLKILALMSVLGFAATYASVSSISIIMGYILLPLIIENYDFVSQISPGSIPIFPLLSITIVVVLGFWTVKKLYEVRDD